MFIYGGFVFLSVYAYTELMDRNVFAIIWEILKNILGIGIIFYYGDWFGAEKYISGINYLLVTYFILASCITAWFVFYDFRKIKPSLLINP